MKRPFVVGTRGSALARAQTALVLDRLREAHPGRSFEERIVSTSGDRLGDRPLAAIEGTGVFVREIEEALLRGEIDAAVHSLKDLPLDAPPGLRLGAVLERGDPRDALVGCRLADLPHGARVGTGSPRRRAQLLLARPDLRFEPIRGNVDTRLEKRKAQALDAVVLAAAGLDRLGRSGDIAERLPPAICLPEPGQGALAVEVRAEDAEAGALVAPLEHPDTRIAVEAERALLHFFGGGCHLPLGALGDSGPAGCSLIGTVVSPDGSRFARARVEGANDPSDAASRAGRDLERHGARAILEDLENPKPVGGRE